MNAAAGLTTILFVPGSKPERTSRAMATSADVVCIDLEDSVPASLKAQARQAALDAIAAVEPRLALRINSIATRVGLEDLIALADATVLPSLLLIPMVNSAAEMSIVTSVLGARTPGLIPLIETVKGLRVAREIASASGVVAMMFGGGDFAAELGVELAWEPLLAARSAIVLACAEAGIPAIDVPCIVLDDTPALVAETRAAKALGFSAKAAIHPAQLEGIDSVLRPTAEEIAEAEEAERVFADAGGAAVRFKGRMLEAPIMRRYRRILAMRSKTDA